MPKPVLRPLADNIPEPGESMSIGEVKILQGLALVAARIDDVVQPSIISCEHEIHSVLSLQDKMLNAQERLEGALRNGVRRDISALQTRASELNTLIEKQSGDLSGQITGLGTTIGNLDTRVSKHLREPGRNLWGEIKNTVVFRKKTAIFVGLIVLTVLPWLQKVAAAVLVMALKKITGVDLGVIMPWLF